MAAKTPTNLAVHNMGSLNLHIAYFNNLDPDDVWSSSMSNIVAAWANKRNDAVNGSGAGIAVSWTHSGGVFNFSCDTNSTADCFVLTGWRR